MTEGKENWGTYHISASLSDYEVARSNFFTFIVDDLDTLIKSDYALPAEQLQANDVIKGGQEILKLSVSKASVPHFSIEPIALRRMNSVIKYAGNVSFDAGSLELDDFVGLRTKAVLMAWQALAYDVINDTGGRAIDYKKNCTLIEMDQAKHEINRWDLIGCWISDIKEEDFDVNADGERKLNVTIQYDRAIMHNTYEDLKKKEISL